MLNRGFHLVASLILAALLISACGTTPNDHNIEENEPNEPPANEENTNFNNNQSNFNDQDNLNENFNKENNNQ